ncbi:uncharacterized protein LOC126176481 [Schistocerca cancellata]|uniref:uncharacterized protein LOC126176481 n=1 Tax=Schistocerca cancellata TaxID=274614 RepID=UPI0021198131|nr:uncharacterized protein LOC126176481 [Schistocerca cancellata]
MKNKHFTASWYRVSDDTIRNCFRKAGFGNEVHDHGGNDHTDDTSPNDEEWNRLEEQASFEDYVNDNENLITTEPMTITEIVQCALRDLDEEETDDEDDTEKPQHSSMTFNNASNALEIIKQFVTHHNVSDELMTELSHFDGTVYATAASKKKQAKIMDTFTK